MRGLKKAALLVHSETLSKTLGEQNPLLIVKHLPDFPAGYAQQLYTMLREADESGVEMILMEAVPQTQAWEAIYNRLASVAETGKQLKATLLA